MKAIRIHEHGGPDVLRLEEVRDPEPGPGQALVRLDAAGLNFIDIYFRTGAYRPAALPFTPGGEGAGTVVAVGPGVTEVSPGDRVASFNLSGSYAELAVAPAVRLVRVPDGLSTRQAAAALLQGMTAHYLARSTYPLKEGDTCLVHAAAGGVGLLLCQMASRLGARVIGTAGSPGKAELARQAGAHEVILYAEVDFSTEVRRLTDGRGVNVAYDSVGRATFAGSLDSLAPRGLLVLYGQASGAVPPVDPQVLNQKGSLFLTRPTLGHYTATREELLWRSGEVLTGVADGRLKLRVDRELPLAAAAEAQGLLEGRQTTGKVLLAC